MPEDSPDEELQWAVKLGDKTLQVRDLPIGVLDQISRDCEVSWAFICALPQGDLRVAERLIFAIAERLEVDPPDVESLTARTVAGYFVQVPDDLPTEFNGVVPQ